MNYAFLSGHTYVECKIRPKVFRMAKQFIWCLASRLSRLSCSVFLRFSRLLFVSMVDDSVVGNVCMPEERGALGTLVFDANFECGNFFRVKRRIFRQSWPGWSIKLMRVRLVHSSRHVQSEISRLVLFCSWERAGKSSKLTMLRKKSWRVGGYFIFRGWSSTLSTFRRIEICSTVRMLLLCIELAKETGLSRFRLIFEPF